MTLSQHAREASVAHCDLSTLYSVIAILEGGTISASHYKDVQRIIAICKSGGQKALARYDKHMDAIREGWVQ